MSEPMSPIVIRALEPEDRDALWELLLCPGVQRETLTLPYISRAEAHERMSAPRDNRHTLVAEIDGKVVGQCALNAYGGRRAHVGAVGLTVHDNYVGRGVGSALLRATIGLAENWLGLSRLELEVYTDNERAIHVYRSLGFAIEGTKRHYALRDGAYVDAHVMARVRSAS